MDYLFVWTFRDFVSLVIFAFVLIGGLLFWIINTVQSYRRKKRLKRLATEIQDKIKIEIFEEILSMPPRAMNENEMEDNFIRLLKPRIDETAKILRDNGVLKMNNSIKKK